MGSEMCIRDSSGPGRVTVLLHTQKIGPENPEICTRDLSGLRPPGPERSRRDEKTPFFCIFVVFCVFQKLAVVVEGAGRILRKLPKTEIFDHNRFSQFFTVCGNFLRRSRTEKTRKTPGSGRVETHPVSRPERCGHFVHRVCTLFFRILQKNAIFVHKMGTRW